MFRAYMKEFETTPEFAVGDVVLVRYDIANDNGVLVRGTPVIITEVVIGSYNEGISYAVEDNDGNFAVGVKELMLKAVDERIACQRLFDVVESLRKRMETSRKHKLAKLKFKQGIGITGKVVLKQEVLVDRLTEKTNLELVDMSNLPKQTMDTKPIPPPKVKKFKVRQRSLNKGIVRTRIEEFTKLVKRRFKNEH